jgi:outer membrane lipoprotein-sorting protein
MVMAMKRLFCFGVLSAVLVSVSVPTVSAVSDEETALLEKASAYLNGIDTLQARFLQVDARGGVAEGDLYIDRPGKMRLEYDPPTPVLIVADGFYVIYVDLELDEPSYLDIDDTPAGFLLDPEWSFTDASVDVRNIRQEPGVIEITAADANDPTAGELTFVFSEGPFQLRQWRVKDAQSQEVTVTLYETQTGVDFDSDLFTYKEIDVFDDD